MAVWVHDQRQRIPSPKPRSSALTLPREGDPRWGHTNVLREGDGRWGDTNVLRGGERRPRRFVQTPRRPESQLTIGNQDYLTV